MTFVQRFDSTLGSFVHLHVVALDSERSERVFTRAHEGLVVFHEGPAPSHQDVAAVAARVAERMLRWMRRRKLLEERPLEERSNEAPEVSPMEACMQLSLFGGTFVKLDKDGAKCADVENDEPESTSSPSAWSFGTRYS